MCRDGRLASSRDQRGAGSTPKKLIASGKQVLPETTCLLEAYFDFWEAFRPGRPSFPSVDKSRPRAGPPVATRHGPESGPATSSAPPPRRLRARRSLGAVFRCRGSGSSGPGVRVPNTPAWPRPRHDCRGLRLPRQRPRVNPPPNPMEAHDLPHGTRVARPCRHVRASHWGTPDAHRPGRPRGGGRFFWGVSGARGPDTARPASTPAATRRSGRPTPKSTPGPAPRWRVGGTTASAR